MRLEQTTVTGLPAPVWGQRGERPDGAGEALGGGVRIYSGDKGGGVIEKQVRGKKGLFLNHSFGFFTTEWQRTGAQRNVSGPAPSILGERGSHGGGLANELSAPRQRHRQASHDFMVSLNSLTEIKFTSHERHRVKPTVQRSGSLTNSYLPHHKGVLQWSFLVYEPHWTAPWGHFLPFLCSCSFTSAPSWGSLQFYFLESSTV